MTFLGLADPSMKVFTCTRLSLRARSQGFPPVNMIWAPCQLFIDRKTKHWRLKKKTYKKKLSDKKKLINLFYIVDGWTAGYTFHGDAGRVFKEFFGGDNPFAGTKAYMLEKELHCTDYKSTDYISQIYSGPFLSCFLPVYKQIEAWCWSSKWVDLHKNKVTYTWKVYYKIYSIHVCNSEMVYLASWVLSAYL